MSDVKKPYCFGIPSISEINHCNPELGGWCDECPQFVECQEASENPPKLLTLPMKKKYYDMILAGTKKEEYRIANRYWLSRVKGKTFDVLAFQLGYPERGNLKRRAWFKCEGISFTNMGWLNEQEYYSGATVVIAIGDRLDYPYQVME